MKKSNENKVINNEQTTPVVETTPVNPMAEAINAIMMNADMTETDKWAAIARLSASKIDETTLPLDKCSDAELMRRLKLIWSKKTQTKKALEGSQAMYNQAIDTVKELNNLLDAARTAEAEGRQPEQEITLLEENIKKSCDAAESFRLLVEKWQKDFDALLVKEQEIGAYRTTNGTRTVRVGVVAGDADPSKLDQLALGKLIRNYQSKKCSAKKAGDATMEAHWQAKVDEASKHRTSTPAQQKVSEMATKLQETITALEALPKSDVVAAQIEALKALLQ